MRYSHGHQVIDFVPTFTKLKLLANWRRSNEEAFRTGDWKWQERSVDALICAMEGALMGFKSVALCIGTEGVLTVDSLWTYNPANRDDIGDDVNFFVA